MKFKITYHPGYVSIWPEKIIVSHIFEKPAARVARRFKEGGVVQLKPKGPRVPSVLIHGRKYALSNYWPMMGDLEEMGGGEGGARLITPPEGSNKWRYLWAFDTDRKILGMWRYSDGDEKLNDRASSHQHLIVTLEKKGQLNRVTHEEMVLVEREMQKRQDDTIRALKQTIKENETDWDRQVADILKKHFEDEIYPVIDRRLKELENGVVPFGFKMHDYPKSREDQMRTFVVTQEVSKFKQEMAYDLVTKEVGYDAWEPPHGGDGQAVQWAWHELIEATYDKYLR